MAVCTGLDYNSKLARYNGVDAWEAVAPTPPVGGAPVMAVSPTEIYCINLWFRIYKWNKLDDWIQVTTNILSGQMWNEMIYFNGDLFAGEDALFKSTGATGEWVQVAPAAAVANPSFDSLIIFEGSLFRRSPQR